MGVSARFVTSSLCAAGLLASSGFSPAGQEPDSFKLVVVHRPSLDDKVLVLHLAGHIATSIRMPEPVNSIVVGDPLSFQVEHSDKEPRLVTVKPTSGERATTNLLITTASGRQANLLLVSGGDPMGAGRVDVLLKYAGIEGRSFLVENAAPSSVLVSDTRGLNLDGATPGPSAASEIDLGKLLNRQRRAKLPVLYGQRPGEIQPGKRIRAGVSEALDSGTQVVVLFSVVNPGNQAIEVEPPQVQLGGKIRQGKVFRRSRWLAAEQLPVIDYRLEPRRIAPGERADGVVLLERPPYKQSTETLFLQIADSGAVDKPALAPIGFGISTLGGSDHAGSEQRHPR